MKRRARLGKAGTALVLAGGLWAGAGGCQKASHEPSARDRAASPGGAPQSPEALAEPLARVDNTVITVKDLEDAINRQSPYVRARYTSREQKKVFLDNMVRFEVLAEEAARRGFDKDPEVVETMKSAMITKLLKDELKRAVKPEDIPEAELQAYYNQHQDEFNKPEEVRVSAIVLRRKKQANEVAALARGDAGATNKGFRDLVLKYSSDEDTKLRGGDLRYFARDSTDVPRAVVDAAFGLARTGDVAGPIAAGSRYYVIKQTGRRPAVKHSFDQARRQIQNQLYKDKREAQQRSFVEGLRAKAKIQIYQDNLKKVRVDTHMGVNGGGAGANLPAYPAPKNTGGAR